MKVSLNKKLKPFAAENWRYKVAHGGRGSAKSWTIARILLLKASRAPLRILCAREIQDSIKDSVHKLLSDQIDMLELEGYTITDKAIRHTSGSEFLFKGLFSNLSKIKSFEGVDICWIEEAESISAKSWEILDPTIRKPGSEMWISFNPRYEDDIIYKTFVYDEEDNPKPDNACVVQVNWQDNIHFPLELEKQKDHMYKVDPDLADHIWGGEIKRNTAEQVMANKWVVEDFKTPIDEQLYYGADWGFSQDPNTVNRCFVGSHETWGSNCLYLDYEANDRPYGIDNTVGTNLNDLHKVWEKIPLIRKHEVYADCARPETISLMKRDYNFDVSGASKWPGSVEDGVEFLRGFDKIIIHPRCENTKHEFKNYKYKVDLKTGEITKKILDKYNHHMDAIRYAIGKMIRKRGNQGTWWDN